MVFLSYLNLKAGSTSHLIDLKHLLKKINSNIGLTWLINVGTIGAVDLADIEMVLKLTLLTVTIVWTVLRVIKEWKKRKNLKEDNNGD
jgi:hypothetical protein